MIRSGSQSPSRKQPNPISAGTAQKRSNPIDPNRQKKSPKKYFLSDIDETGRTDFSDDFYDISYYLMLDKEISLRRHFKNDTSLRRPFDDDSSSNRQLDSDAPFPRRFGDDSLFEGQLENDVSLQQELSDDLDLLDDDQVSKPFPLSFQGPML